MILQNAGFVSLIFLCLAGVGFCFLLYGRLFRLRRLSAVLDLERRAALRCLTAMGANDAGNGFASTLDKVGLQTRLSLGGSFSNASAKYRYAASLAAYGFDAAKIAKVLEISSREAEQVLRLAALNAAHNTAKEKPPFDRKK